MLNNIPTTWIQKYLSDSSVAQVIMGQSPDSSSYNEERDGLPFYQGKTDFGRISPTPRVWCSKPVKIAEADDILLSVRAPVGAVNMCTEKSCIGRGLCAIRTKEIILPKFLYYFFVFYEPILKTQGSGAVFDAITKAFVDKIKVPIPPTLAEQQEIVQVLDTMNDIIRLRKECISHAQDLIPALFQEMFKPYANCTKTVLNNLFEFKSGGTPSKQVEEYFQGDIPWITTVALNKLFIGKEDANELITEEAIQKSATKLIPANSLLFGTRVGIGKLAINTVPMCTNQDIVAMIPFENNNLNLVYAYWYLKQINNFFVANGRGATIQGITTHLVRSTEIILPPLKVQEQFAQKVIEIESYIKEQRDELENAEQMFQSLLHHAFTGELTRRAYGKD